MLHRGQKGEQLRGLHDNGKSPILLSYCQLPPEGVEEGGKKVEKRTLEGNGSQETKKRDPLFTLKKGKISNQKKREKRYLPCFQRLRGRGGEEGKHRGESARKKEKKNTVI